jgi:uncharacterized protein YidB (DUF937 family)
MSGMLGQLLGGLLGGGQTGQQCPLAGILQQVLAGGGQGSAGAAGGAQGGGGISAVVSRFEAAGLGQQAQSWVGTGANQPVTPDQVGQVFPAEQIRQWASQAGTTPDAMRQVLAEALPHAVDHLTPGGQPPAQTADISGMLQSLLGQLGGTRRA